MLFRSPTPCYSSSQFSFSIVSSVRIAAPAALVASAILDASSWGEWNSFVPKIEVTEPGTAVPYPDGLSMPAGGQWVKHGDKFTMQVNMFGLPLSSLHESKIARLQQSKEIVTYIEALDPAKEEAREGYRICWKLEGGFAGLVRADRVQECVALEDGGCEWSTWESFGGSLGMGMMLRLALGGKLVERFGDWGRDLKVRCEELQKKKEEEEQRRTL